MCEACYRNQYGSPKNITPEALKLSAELEQLYPLSHGQWFLDNWNVDDSDIGDMLAEALEDDCTPAERSFLFSFAALPMKQRAVVLALHENILKP